MPRNRNQSRVVKFVRNTLISMGILLVVTLGTGVAYTWYVGQSSPGNASVSGSSDEAVRPAVMKPATRTPGAKVSASVQSLTSPVTPGSNTSVIVRTNPEATCTISVVYNEVASADSGLKPRVADEYGMVSWTWTVEASVPIGTWPVKVTCALEKQSAVVQGDLKVSKTAS